ncbi:MAG: ATP-dependent DNA helicase RecQ [Chitinophagales bacterium]
MITPLQILQQYWKHAAFRPMQETIINTVAEGHDTLVLLPTGGGKSICFQVPALMRGGLCLVVSPLIALMNDQVRQLTARGIKAVAIHTGMPASIIDTTLDNAVYGKMQFLYVSPERLASADFKARVTRMPVKLIAVDEAHCISQWGYDFRPAYLNIHQLRELLPDVPVVALTATATPKVVADIQEKLTFNNGKVFTQSFVRKNLSYVVRMTENKSDQLLDILKKVPGSSIVYVRNRKATKEIATLLSKHRISSGFYHAGLDTAVRQKTQADWISGNLRVMVCTNAFGMGIDKPDVRTVIHLEPPDSLEAYFQEAGRAGRDQQRAYAIQLAHPGDIAQLKDKMETEYPSFTEIRTIYNQIGEFLHVAYHEGEGKTFDFDISDFSKRYAVGPVKVLHALRLLETQQLLFANEGVLQRPLLKVACSRETLYKFQVENRRYDPLIKSILRALGGVFDHYIAFDERQLAQKTGLSVEALQTQLQYLTDIDILHYQPRKDQPQVLWLNQRIPLADLQLDKPFLESRLSDYSTRLLAVIEYLQNQQQCRSSQLVHYFGEKAANACGVCDVCLSRKKQVLTQEQMETLSELISDVLRQNPQTTAALALHLNLPVKDVEEVVIWLLDAGIIQRDMNGKLRWETE